MHKANQSFCPMVLAVSLGLVWGLSAAGLAWIAACCGYGSTIVNVMATVYIGYSTSFLGGLIGLVWGFFDMFIGAVLVIYVYRFLSCYLSKCSAGKEKCCTPD